jgi:DNA-directed RNA polymerase subunit RPC12/RpoP
VSVIFETEPFRCATCGATREDDATTEQTARVLIHRERAPERDRGEKLAHYFDVDLACAGCGSHRIVMYLPKIDVPDAGPLRGKIRPTQAS